MNFPGKRSLFINCEFKLLKNSISKKNYFKIKEFDQLISKLNIEYNIGKYFVKTNSLLLPFPKKNITTKKKLTILKKNSLSVLVLGGSRGLGLLTTRLLLNSNFRVYSTFNNYDKNLKDLKKIFKNRIKIIKCDILKLKDQRKIFSNISKFNFIFNFTSCKILKTSGKFNKDYYNLLNKYYLNPIKFFFKKIRNSKSKTKFFSPSTIYIEDKEKKNNFKEYVKAKANTEKLIKKLNNKSNKIFYYFRFDEYDTDQQYSLFPKKIINDINSFVKVIDLFINTKK